jgi:thioredoxin 1
MGTHARVGPIALLVAGLAACDGAASRDLSRPASATDISPAPAAAARPVPRLVDLGAGKCIPCKAMAPILAQLGADYAGRLDVVFIDVWKEPDQAQAYGVHMIPTQIFYGADGRELARHQGFIDRDGILSTWARLGVRL